MPTSEVVVADTSPLIHLDRVGRIDLLRQLFGRVTVPLAVAEELLAGRAHGIAVPDLAAMTWIEVHPDRMDPRVTGIQGIHRGEAAALSLALVFPNHLLIVDDLAGRNAAIELRLRFIGTAGALVRAKRAGIISSVAVLLDELAATGFRLAPSVRRRLLLEVAEE